MKSSTAWILASVIFIAVAASAQTPAQPHAVPEQPVAPQQAPPQQPQTTPQQNAVPQQPSAAQPQSSSQQNVSSEGQALHVLVSTSVVVSAQAPMTRASSNNPSVSDTLD